MAEKNLPKDLTENRKEIDQIDQKLLNLIHERSKLVINAGKIKKKSGDKTFYRPDREASLIKTLQKKNKSSIPAENIKFIFKEIISACFTLEKKIKVYSFPEFIYEHSKNKTRVVTISVVSNPCVIAQ